jgi:hypothetical protein
MDVCGICTHYCHVWISILSGSPSEKYPWLEIWLMKLHRWKYHILVKPKPSGILNSSINVWCKTSALGGVCFWVQHITILIWYPPNKTLAECIGSNSWIRVPHWG